MEVCPQALAYEQPTAGATTDELGDSLNKFEEITNYNNYYEFSTNKEAVAGEAQELHGVPMEGRGRRSGRQAQDLRHR